MRRPRSLGATTVGLAAALGLTYSAAVAAPAAQTPVEPSRIAGFVDIFAPGADGPDFTLVITAKESGPVREVTRTIRRHGAWVRIDEAHDGRESTKYVHLPSGTVIETAGNAEGPVRYLGIRKPDFRRDGMDYRSVRTGRRLTVAGEPCDEWDVYHSGDFHRFGCITSDGIELSRWTANAAGRRGYFSATATSISKAPVKAADVEPPRRIFDLERWLASAAKGRGGTGDFEVVLASLGGGQTRTIRGHKGWRYVENRRADGAREITSQLADAGLWFSASIDRNGVPQKVELREAPPLPDVSQPSRRPGETIFGLSCLWYDTMPGVFDAGQLECRTNDGVVLKIVETNWGSSTEFDAIRLDRKPQSREAVLPTEFFDLNRWIAP